MLSSPPSPAATGCIPRCCGDRRGSLYGRGAAGLTGGGGRSCWREAETVPRRSHSPRQQVAEPRPSPRFPGRRPGDGSSARSSLSYRGGRQLLRPPWPPVQLSPPAGPPGARSLRLRPGHGYPPRTPFAAALCSKRPFASGAYFYCNLIPPRAGSLCVSLSPCVFGRSCSRRCRILPTPATSRCSPSPPSPGASPPPAAPRFAFVKRLSLRAGLGAPPGEGGSGLAGERSPRGKLRGPAAPPPPLRPAPAASPLVPGRFLARQTPLASPPGPPQGKESGSPAGQGPPLPAEVSRGPGRAPAAPPAPPGDGPQLPGGGDSAARGGREGGREGKPGAGCPPLAFWVVSGPTWLSPALPPPRHTPRLACPAALSARPPLH